MTPSRCDVQRWKPLYAVIGALSALALVAAMGVTAVQRTAEAQYGDLPALPAAPAGEPTVGAPIVEATISPTTGGTATSPDGTVTVTAPPGAVSENTTLSVAPVSGDVSTAAPPPAGNLIVGGKVFDVSATDAGGNDVATFGAPISLSFQLDPSDLAGVNPADFVVYFFDTQTNAWAPLPTVVDPVTGVATATVNHLTLFAVMKATFVELTIVPGPNLLPYTGPDGTPITTAFKDSIDRIEVVWQLNSALQVWRFFLPDSPAISTFTTLRRFDVVFVALRGGQPVPLRMLAP